MQSKSLQNTKGIRTNFYKQRKSLLFLEHEIFMKTQKHLNKLYTMQIISTEESWDSIQTREIKSTKRAQQEKSLYVEKGRASGQ